MSPSAPTIDNASACVRKPTAYPSDRRRGGGSDALEPHAGRAVINAGAVTFYSVVDDYIFRARSAIGDADADRWRHSARTAYWRIGAAVDSKLSLSLSLSDAVAGHAGSDLRQADTGHGSPFVKPSQPRSPQIGRHDPSLARILATRSTPARRAATTRTPTSRSPGSSAEQRARHGISGGGLRAAFRSAFR
jgi:hypothetical protein